MKTKSLLLILSCAFWYGCNNKDNNIQIITASEMQNHLKFENIQVVDVQPKEQYKKSHLLNAQNIIYDKNFNKKLETLDKTRPVAIYCTTGTVSPQAAEILRDAGFQHIYILEGGIKKWAVDSIIKSK